MNADRLLALYERTADAPDAVVRLRRLVLDLAVRGKLMPQDASDESAAELLKRIVRKKARLVEAGEIRTPKAASPLAYLPFAIPSNWRWSQLAEIGLLSPRNDAPDTYRASFVPMPLISAEYGIANQHEVRTWGAIKKGYTHFAEGDVGLAKITPCFENGKSTVFRNLTGGIGAGTTELHIVRPLFVDQNYVLVFLKSPYFIENGIPRMTGTAGQKRVPAEYFFYSPFPLPPLAEQHRIVAKVNELMGLCDRLEAVQVDREAVRDRLAAATLGRLAVPDPETSQADIRFTLDALPALTARPDQIKALRQTILSVAMRGELVPQDTSDEPASKLLVRIAQEVSDYTKINRIGQVQADPITDRDLPFAAPDGWRWTRLNSLFKIITDGDHQPPPKADEGVAFLTIGNITTGHLDFVGCRLVPEAYFKSLAAYRTPTKGDILYTVVGATYGRPAFVETDRTFCVQRHIAILKPVDAMSLRYLLALLASPLIYDQATRSTTGTAQPTIALRPLRNFLVPLPPLAEQHRIVAKVDALMALCDRLETALAAADSARARLLDALLAETLAFADDGSKAAVEPTGAVAPVSPSAVTTTERSAFVLALAYERHRFARRDRTFGHVKAEKILHLVEAEAGLDLGRAPIRDAAGPNDFPHLLGVDRWAKQHRRFDFDRKGKGYTFEPLADFQKSLQVVESIDAPTRARIEAIIDLFVPMDTEVAELFATVYVAWNNLLIEGKSPDDAAILRTAREDWHPKKLQILREKFVAALQRVKASAFVPCGRGKFVPPAPQRDLFPRQ